MLSSNNAERCFDPTAFRNFFTMLIRLLCYSMTLLFVKINCGLAIMFDTKSCKLV